MRIPILYPPGNTDKHWIILELQGFIEVEPNSFESEVSLGNLQINKDNGNAHLTIGNHLLEGKLVKLQKPFAIMEKVNTEKGVQYEVVSVAKEKYLFKTRPKPISS